MDRTHESSEDLNGQNEYHGSPEEAGSTNNTEIMTETPNSIESLPEGNQHSNPQDVSENPIPDSIEKPEVNSEMDAVNESDGAHPVEGAEEDEEEGGYEEEEEEDDPESLARKYGNGNDDLMKTLNDEDVDNREGFQKAEDDKPSEDTEEGQNIRNPWKSDDIDGFLQRDQRLVPSERPKYLENHVVSEEYALLNNQYAEKVLTQNEKMIVYEFPDIPQPEYKDPPASKFDLSGASPDKSVDDECIKKFIKLPRLTEINDIPNVGAICTDDTLETFKTYPTESLFTLGNKSIMLELSDEPVFPGQERNLCRGFFQVVESVTGKVLSTELAFTIDNSARFSLSSSNKGVLFVKDATPKSMLMACLTETVPNSNNAYHVSALTVVPLFNPDGTLSLTTSFPRLWSRVPPGQYLKVKEDASGHLPNENKIEVNMVLKASLLQPDSSDVALPWIPNASKPPVAIPYPFPFTTPLAALSNIKLTGRKPSKKPAVTFFRLAISSLSPNSPISPLSVFPSPEYPELVNWITSSVLKPDTSISWPDIIPFVIDRDLSQCTLMVHIYEGSNEKTSVPHIGIVAVPLSQLIEAVGSEITFDISTIKQANHPNFRGSQKSKRGDGLSITLEYPSIYYHYPQMDKYPSALSSLALPETANAIESGDAQLIDNLWSKFEALPETQIRSWLRDCFKPREEFTSQYAATLSSVLTTSSTPKGFGSRLGLHLEAFLCANAIQRAPSHYSALLDTLLEFILNGNEDSLDTADLFFAEAATVIPFDELSRIIVRRLRGVSTDSIYLKVLMPMTTSPHMAYGLAKSVRPFDSKLPYSPFTPMSSALLLSISRALQSGKPELIDLACSTMSHLIDSARAFPEEMQSALSLSLLPILSSASSSFPSISPQRRSLLSPSLIFILGHAPADSVSTILSSLSPAFQQLFVTFLNAVVKSLPTTAIYSAAYTISRFTLLSLESISRSLPQIGPLFSNFLTPPYLRIVYGTIEQTLDLHHSNRSLTSWVTSLAVSSPSREVRCLGIALLLHAFSTEHLASGHALLTSAAFMDALTTAVLESDPEGIDVAVKSLTLLSTCVDLYRRPTLTSIVKERVKAALEICKTVRTQKTSTLPLSTRAEALMTIADQYTKFPQMRLKWLSELARLNKMNGDIISELVCRIHMAALASAIVCLNKPQQASGLRTIPKAPPIHLTIAQPYRMASGTFKYETTSSAHDFQFMPSALAETRVNKHQLEKESGELIGDFDMALYISLLKDAITLCQKVNIPHTMRPLCSLLLREASITRDYPLQTEVYRYLSEALLGKDKGGVRYFVLENGKQRRLFAVPAEEKDFVTRISENEQIEGLVLCTNYFERTTSEPCLIEVKPSETVASGEEPHSHRKFRTIGSLTMWYDAIASEHVPNYRQGVPIKSWKKGEATIETVANKAVQEATQKLRDASDAILEIVADSSLKNSWGLTTGTSFNGDLHNLGKMAISTITGPESAGEYIEKCRKDHPEEAQVWAASLVKELYGVVTVMRTCATQADDTGDISLTLLSVEDAATNFANKWSIGAPEASDIKRYAREDPMLVRFPWEH